MAFDWKTVLEDDTIPNDLEVDLGEGRKLKLGDLRTRHKEEVGNLTKGYQKLSAREKELQARENALAAHDQGPQPGQPADDDDGFIPENVRQLAAVDPTYDAIAKTLKALRGEVTKLRAEGTRAIQELQKDKWKQYHLNSLRIIKERDPEVNQQELVQYALENNIHDLSVAHGILTRDRDIAKARTEGLEEGKKNAATPFIPSGIRSVTQRPSAEAPKSADDLVSKASADPEIVKAFAEGMIPGAGG